MNTYYAKTVLYAYPNLEAVMEQIDELVERKALSSMSDYSPCIEIAEKILNFTDQKDVLIRLKICADIALKRFTEEEKDCLDYKFFKLKPKEYYEGFDFESRGYFRKQIRVANKFAKEIEKIGITDEWFEKRCLKCDFFRELLKRVVEHEVKSHKNKPKSQKKQGNAVKVESVRARIPA